MVKRFSKAWIGLGLGILLGLTDLVVLVVAGIEMRHGDVDMAVPVMAVFMLTVGALGYAIGRLSEARERIRAQLDELRRTQQQMLDIEKLASIGRMAAGVAHEVRNPLGVIKSSAALLVDCVDPTEEDAVQAGRFIALEIDRLDGFIRSLLDFSRPLTPTRDEVTAEALACRVRELGVDAAHAAGAALEVSASGGPWALDLDMVARAVATLVVNAIQAAGEGGNVGVTISDGADGALITVADDGPGIDDDVAHKIFEPFVTTKAKGTGLGLPMAQRIIEAHHGVIDRLDTAGLGVHGAGACFRLSLPRVHAR